MKQLKLPLLLLGGFLSLHANAKTYTGTDYHQSISQDQNPIKGQIVDQNGLGIADVEIIIKGTSFKTFTDGDGFFEFVSVNVAHPTLLVNSSQHKFIEYTPKDISQVKITLQEESNQLNEVIVTALGIKREQKKLGFAQQNIGSEELATAEANNWSSGLKGKVAGLNIISGGNGPINSQQIILRGANSIDQSKNYALIVIDGVPMSTEMTSSGNNTAYMGDDSPIDFGNGISDINQADIESVTVLKGPAAAALYGNKAANGALIITTKSGKKGKQLGLEYKSTVAIDVINNQPDFQYEYGQGTGKSFDKNGNPYYSYQTSADGPNTGSTSSAFGPKFDGQSFFQYDPTLEKQGAERTLWRAYKDNRKGFWQTGFTFSNAFTGRNDWNSSVAVKYSSFFYPSVSSSFILSDLFKIKGPINYLKYRLSFAKVGNGGTTGWTNRYYDQSDFTASAVVPGRLFNPDIKPESTTSWETGFEALLFKKRLSLDFTVYQQSTKNQIFELPNDITTGYSRRVVNGGEIENRGIEIAATYSPIKSKDFEWKMIGTWAKNENKVKSLVEGIEGDQMILGQSGTVYQIAKVGGSSTALYGEKFVRNEAGQIIYDAKTGVPLKNGLIEYVGDATPKWRAGFTNEIKFKTLRFSFTLDGQYGGIVYSQTYHKMMEQGKLADSLPGREDGFIIGDGVVLNSDGTYSPNTTKADVATYYAEYNRRANVESNSFEASYLKLRDVSLTFDFPKRLLSKTGLQALSLTVYGRDLFTISDFPLYDPETASLNGNVYVPGVEMGQMPSTATYGVTLKASL